MSVVSFCELRWPKRDTISIVAKLPIVPYTILQLVGGYFVWRVTQSPGQDPVSIIGATGERTDPVASPDYSKIAYLKRNATTGYSTLWVVNADGSGDLELDVSSTQYITHPAWHPDGSKIVYTFGLGGDTQGGNLYTIKPDGTGKTLIYTAATNRRARHPLYNYDGTKIAFRVLDITFPLPTPSDDGVWTMNADGTGAAKIASTKNAGAGYGHSWAHASNVIAYTEATRSGVAGDYYKINSDGTGKTKLNTGSFGTLTNPQLTKYAWAPDDSCIYTFLFIGGTVHNLYKMPADASGEVAVSPTRTTNGQIGIGQAYVFGSRVYFGQRNPGKLESVALDGSGYRVEHDLIPSGVGDEFYLGTGFESNK